MIHSDTIKLLRECNAGIKMGVASIEDVVDHVKDSGMYNILNKSREDHNALGSKTRQLLNDYDDSGKEPNPLAKGMSKMKTSFKLTVNDTDAAIADLMTDGCNMGVKSLSKYLNQYAAAEEQVKDIAKKLIKIEEQLSVDMRSFL
ncbi:MAG: hypothetical protein IKU25_03620 [Clostridia bacterium]|nr:hypothetical protein [Clostridia bacterium]